MDLNEVLDYVRQNAVLNERITELTALQSELKKNIREGIADLGVANDKGHVIVELNDEVSGIREVMQQRKVSKSLDIEVAEEILKSKGLHDRCIEMVPVLNEDEIMSAYWENLITEEDIDKMFPAKVTWALVMSKS